MLEFMNVTKALSDENRVRILMALHERGELCVCHLIELLGLAASTVSKHLFLLRNARLIKGRKDGRWMHYRLNGDSELPAATAAIRWVIESVKNHPEIVKDRQRLNEFLAEPAREHCRR